MQTIVVGYDETDASERALERTGDIAAAFGSTVIVTSVSAIRRRVARRRLRRPDRPPDAHDSMLTAGKDKLVDRGVHAETVLGIGIQPRRSSSSPNSGTPTSSWWGRASRASASGCSATA